MATLAPTAVCIPVRGDRPGLATTLLSISALDPPPSQVIVAVDGPDDGLEEEARRFAATVVVTPEPRGSYAARNAAIDLVDEAVDAVLFTDAGCIVSPDWVTGHLATLRTADLSGGAVEVPLPPRPRAAEYVDARRNLRQRAYVEEAGYAATCNLGVRRRVLDAVRFDASMRSGGDRAFCHDARDEGCTIAFSADAVVVHPPRRTWRSVLDKARRVGEGVRSLPPERRPQMLPAPRFGFGLAREHPHARSAAGVPWMIAVATLDYLRTRTFVAAATSGDAR